MNIKPGRKLAMIGTVTAGAAVVLAVAFTAAHGPGLLRASPPAIGTAEGRGAFRVDNATVRGNATLFEGAIIETSGGAGRTVSAGTSRAAASPGAAASVSMELLSGARVRLASGSKGRLFSDHLILERGMGELQKAEGLKLEARGLMIQPETGNASARVALVGASKVDVAALSGSFRVLNSQGVLIAALNSGRAIQFEPQTPNAPSKVTGCLVYKGGHYLLTDETTNVVIEVAGPGLDKEKGNRVEVTGGMDPTATPVSDASQFVRATTVKRLSKSCAATAAAGAGGAGGAAKAGGGAGGLSTTTIAIIGGVAAAGVVGGLVGSGALSSSGSTVSR